MDCDRRGGGLSGLAVALGCKEAGHDVSLYEASDQLGGRMMTRPEGQHYHRPRFSCSPHGLSGSEAVG